MASSASLRVGYYCLWMAAAILAPRPSRAITFNADLIYTSDYVFRGISETGGRSAAQIDLRAGTADGTFVGVFASTLKRLWKQPGGIGGWNYEVQAYLGHRFDLSPSWSTTVVGTSYSYLDGKDYFDEYQPKAPPSNDYNEISVTTSYLDLWSVEVAWIPNAVRFEHGMRMGRYPAGVVSTSGQLPLVRLLPVVGQLPLVGRLALAAGAGYYSADSDGYAFGNAGLAFEFKSLRVDAGYYVAQKSAQALFPYGRAGSRYAATVTWHF